MNFNTTKFWSKVDKTDACWVWNGSFGSHGYGQFYDRNPVPQCAHRVSWQIANGPIPDGLFVLHRCDNKQCVRPDHLFVGTHMENMRDMCSKGRQSRFGLSGEAAPSAKLTDEAVREIRAVFVKGWAGRGGNAEELARKFGVTSVAIRFAARGKTWRHVS